MCIQSRHTAEQAVAPISDYVIKAWKVRGCDSISISDE
jgi:hypothetical protein